MVLDIKGRDKTVRLTYVAILRVKKLLGLIFKRGFNKERFQPSISKAKEV